MALVALDPLDRLDQVDALAIGDPLAALVSVLAAQEATAESLVHVRRVGARPEVTAGLERPLPPEVAERLGVTALWSHQARAIDLARAGRSVVVATGTASGKSLCYQAPLAEAAMAPVRRGTSLLVFPTKALAHDQLRALTECDFPGVVAGAYDGDTGNEERAWIRRHATTVLTNPEMLHSGVLPHHDRWATFLGRLRYVVLDELHVFRGIFGSHVAHLVRRLRRLCHHYGSDPTFVCCSATIGQPERLANALCGLPVEPVVDDGSPRPERLVAVWNPPPLDEGSGARVSPNGETARLVAELVRSGQKTIGFCRGRRATEVVAADVRRRVPSRLRRRVAPYRGGFLAEERRAIEDQLFHGRLDGVIATSALELGIDVSGLDAVVMNGFPGTIASFRQQAGRAGRSGRASAAVLVAGSDQLDQWMAAHPDELVDRAPEPVVVNPANPFVADAHLRCAAHEKPLTHADERFWPGMLDDVVRRLALDDQLVVHERGRGAARRRSTPAAGGRRTGSACGPAPAVRWRCAPPTATPSAPSSWPGAASRRHPGASYLHAGQSWRVVDLDLDDRTAVVEPDDGSTYTVARTDVSIRGDRLRRPPPRRRARGRPGPGRGAPAGHRLPAQGHADRRIARGHPPRHAPVDADDPGRLVPRARGAARRRRGRPARRPGRPPRRGARRASGCCRCSRSATGGTSAASRRCTSPTSAARPS